MRIRIEVDDSIQEDEVIIKCKELNSKVYSIQEVVTQLEKKTNFVFYKNNMEYYLPLNSILFFETSGNKIEAHTVDDVYQTKSKLYELEEILPRHFIRASKSTIINCNHIYSIDRNLASSSLVQFYQTHKQVYVSRNYYKELKHRLQERRNYET